MSTKNTNHVRNIPNLQRNPTKKNNTQSSHQSPVLRKNHCQSWPIQENIVNLDLSQLHPQAVASFGASNFWSPKSKTSQKSNGLNVTNVTNDPRGGNPHVTNGVAPENGFYILELIPKARLDGGNVGCQWDPRRNPIHQGFLYWKINGTRIFSGLGWNCRMPMLDVWLIFMFFWGAFPKQ